MYLTYPGTRWENKQLIHSTARHMPLCAGTSVIPTWLLFLSNHELFVIFESPVFLLIETVFEEKTARRTQRQGGVMGNASARKSRRHSNEFHIWPISRNESAYAATTRLRRTCMKRSVTDGFMFETLPSLGCNKGLKYHWVLHVGSWKIVVLGLILPLGTTFF